MRCKHCDARLAAHDFWCANCGKQTKVVTQDLSSWNSLTRTWSKYNPLKGLNIPAAAFPVLAGVLPCLALLFALNAFGRLNLSQNQATGSMLLNLFITSAGLSIFLPILLIPYKPACAEPGYTITLKDMLAGMRQYPRYLVLVLISVLFFVIIHLICFGLPQFSSDPILRLVWIVLVNYFLAVFLPVPVLMQRLNLNSWQAAKLSYRKFHVVRWQLFLLGLILVLMNFVATALVLVPLIIILPLSWFAVRDYVDLLLEYEIIREYK